MRVRKVDFKIRELLSEWDSFDEVEINPANIDKMKNIQNRMGALKELTEDKRQLADIDKFYKEMSEFNKNIDKFVAQYPGYVNERVYFNLPYGSKFNSNLSP